MRNEEIRLVNAMEQAVDECPTLWKIHDILTAFKFLYKRPLFTALIDATADKVWLTRSELVLKVSFHSIFLLERIAVQGGVTSGQGDVQNWVDGMDVPH